VRQQWLVPSAEPTFVIGRLLRNALLSFVHRCSAEVDGQEEPVMTGSSRSLNWAWSLRRQPGVGYQQVDTYG